MLAEFEHDQRRRNLSPGTIGRRSNTLRPFLAAVDPVHCDAADIEAWLDSRDLSSRSRGTYRSTLKVFFEWLVRIGARGDNPAADTHRPRAPRLMPRPLSDDDLSTGLSQADPRMKAWLCLGAFQGFRTIEMAGLRREAVLDDRDPPLLLVEHGKGGHEAVLPLSLQTERALRVYGLDRRGWLFTVDGRPMRPGTIGSYIARHFRSVGVDATAHQLRHWYATRLWALTHDTVLCQQLMRHADLRTFSVYADFDRGAAAEVVRHLDIARPDPDG